MAPNDYAKERVTCVRHVSNILLQVESRMSPEAIYKTMSAIDAEYELIRQINERDIKITEYLVCQVNECTKALCNNPAQIQVEQIPSIIKQHRAIIPLLHEPHQTLMVKLLSNIAAIFLKRQSPKSTRNCTGAIM